MRCSIGIRIRTIDALAIDISELIEVFDRRPSEFKLLALHRYAVLSA